ncbi:MAG: hypothetical protein JRE21_10895 [Deltaproteobacteria bacterium]|jgi:hypothetical protein|nr:hypothetical protein [Deltaproteobacteria bacterium]
MELFKEKFPPTVELAVDKILSDLSVRDRTRIANMNEKKLIEFHTSFGIFIKNAFRLWGNEPLLKSCCDISGLSKTNPDQASFIILKELQKRINESDVLKVVK